MKHGISYPTLDQAPRLRDGLKEAGQPEFADALTQLGRRRFTIVLAGAATRG